MFRGVPRAGVTLAPDWGATTSCEASCCSNEPAVRLELQIAAPIKAESSADLIKRSLVLDDARWLGVVALARDPRTRPLKIAGEQLSDRGHRVPEQRHLSGRRARFPSCIRRSCRRMSSHRTKGFTGRRPGGRGTCFAWRSSTASMPSPNRSASRSASATVRQPTSNQLPPLGRACAWERVNSTRRAGTSGAGTCTRSASFTLASQALPPWAKPVPAISLTLRTTSSVAWSDLFTVTANSSKIGNRWCYNRCLR